jgi:iron complex outermembrane recepter protein
MWKLWRSQLFVFLLFISSALAQDNALQGAADQEPTKITGIHTVVIVTDSKSEEVQESITQKVNVIYDDHVAAQATSVRNISELLQYQPGLSVTVLSRNDANWGSYGGLGPKYNSYLLDGTPIDSFVDTMSLDPWAFARIETHQGPASVMYSNYLSADFAGTQAPLAGISNLVLKERIDKPETRILIDGGSWNTLGARFYHQDHKGNLHYFIGTTYEQSDYTDYGAPNSWLGMLDDPSYKKMKFYGRATYFAGSHQKFSVFAQHTLHSGFTGRPNRDYDHNYDTVNGSYSNQVNDRFNIQLKIGFRNYDRRWGDDNYPTSLALVDHSGVQQKIVPTDLTFNWKHHGASTFTAGADSQYATYRTYTEANAPAVTGNDATSLSAGLYLQEKLVTGNWVLRAGGRFNYTADHYDLIGGSAPGLSDKSWSKFLWSAGVRYNFSKKFSAYSNVGTSFISPAAKSVGGTLNASDFGIVGRNGQLPNPDLKPESGIGSDFGFDFIPIERLTLGVRGFYNRISDAIVDNAVSSTPSQTKSVNAGDARSAGFELVYDHYVSDRIRLFTNFTYTASRISNPFDHDQEGAELSFVPNYVVNSGFELSLPATFKLSPYLHAVGTYYDSTSRSGRSTFGPYQVLNLKVEKALYRTDTHMVLLFTDLNNITNRRYLMPWQFRDPGFNLMGGLDFRF